ncbi:LacI family DNA-binding transcriptional regulator [Arhodomonas sp. AD133]|uniref:LacI family DNA-binding transcriptional regulator n=1 Tax=Arhodomonas sp. AD133 TaxID=3415009 RepID=UPI003EBA9E8C
MVRLKDVAEAAGVSTTTVSHVINGTRRVSPATRERVRNAVARLGYRPDSIAQALKANRSRTIGMIVTSTNNPFFAGVIRGVEDGCFARGYSLVLCNADDVDDKQLAYLQTLRDKRIDGLVVMTSRNGPRFLDTLRDAYRVPTVFMDAAPGAEEDTAVVNDDSRAGGRIGIEFLVGRGFRDIAVLTGPHDHPRSRERLAGAEAALAEAGVALPDERVLATDLLMASGHRAMTHLLGSAGRPEAVFAFNDLAAIGAIRAAADQGLAVPTDISVIGYDDVEISRYLTPALTTVRQPIPALGQTAATVLLDRLDKGTPLPAQTRLAPELVIRDSVAWRDTARARNQPPEPDA